MKVEILDMNGCWVDGRDRGAEGRVEINGVEFNFDLTTEDGMTSIYINKKDNEIWDNRSYVDASLECDEDLDMYDISEEDGIWIYDEILEHVDNAGYELDLE
jgi:hypothetical protein|tara:strand:+ start:179 stop:484 length:306 start_codon:yes stop_codon:yes gene_type:complete